MYYTDKMDILYIDVNSTLTAEKCYELNNHEVSFEESGLIDGSLKVICIGMNRLLCFGYDQNKYIHTFIGQFAGYGTG